MSKFQSTVSTVAALASIFGAAAAGYKLAQGEESKQQVTPPALEQKISQLEEKINQEPPQNQVVPNPVKLPESDTQQVVTDPQVIPVTPPPPLPASPPVSESGQ